MTKSGAWSVRLKMSHHANCFTRPPAITRPSTNGRLALLHTRISLPASFRSPKDLPVPAKRQQLNQSYEGIETRVLFPDRELHGRSDCAQGASDRAGARLRGFDQPR